MQKIPSMLIVISGPSGAGKSTLRSMLLKNHPELVYSVSYTTRKPRNGEINGVDYYFITKDKFEEMISQNEFLEYANVYGNYYGTSKKFVDEALSSGKPIILEVDVQGAESIIKLYPQCCSIFIRPSSIELLIERFVKRGTEDLQDQKKRIEEIKKELVKEKLFSYIVINDNLTDAYKSFENTIFSYAQRLNKNGGYR